MTRLNSRQNRVAGAILAAMTFLPASAGMAAEVSSQAMTLLKNASPNVTVEKQFDGPKGLKGFVISEGGPSKSFIVWMTADESHLIAGNVFDKTGRNLTKVAADHYGSANPVQEMVDTAVEAAVRTTVDQLMPARQQGGAPQQQDSSPQQPEQPEQQQIMTGDEIVGAVKAIELMEDEGRLILQQDADEGMPTATIFFDPGCPHCKVFHNNLESMDVTGLGIQWAPVALFGTQSEAAMALQEGTADAVANSFKKAPILKPIEDASVAAVKENTRDLENELMAGTPIVVIRYGKNDDRDPIALIGPEADEMIKAMQVNEDGKKADPQDQRSE